MRTTSTGADLAPAFVPAVPGDDDAQAAFEALVSSLALKPLTEALGPLGACFGDALARAALLRSRNPER